MTLQEIKSDLLKASLLASESAHFRQMVENVTQRLGKEHTDRLRHTVAADPDILDVVTLYMGVSVDAALEMTEAATTPELDQRIYAAVDAYTDTEGA